jgi:hypothetical protein
MRTEALPVIWLVLSFEVLTETGIASSYSIECMHSLCIKWDVALSFPYRASRTLWSTVHVRKIIRTLPAYLKVRE